MKTVKAASIVRLSYILTCAVLLSTAQMFAYPNTNVQQQPANDAATSTPRQPTVAIFRFAVPAETTATAGPASEVCAQYNSDAQTSASAAAPAKLTIDPKIPAGISTELQQELLKKKMTVMVEPEPDAIPVGSVIVCGRIFNARKGSAAGRMVGLGLGASRLNAHIVLLSKTEGGFAPIDTFDLRLKGRNLFPPGLSTAATQALIFERRQNLPALAKKLADRVVKRLNSDLKRPALTAKN